MYTKGFSYDEYYPSYSDLDLFLQGVPIFENYDSEKDKVYLEQYITAHSTERGILLQRHRVVIVAHKSL